MRHTRLFIPGPVEVDPEVLERLATPMIGHRTGEYSDLQERVTEKTRKLMYTQNDIVFSASSGTGLMEMAVRSTTAKRTIVFSVGAFGNRWHEIAVGNGVAADKHEVQWGDVITPEIVDSYLSTGRYDVATVTHNETSTGVMHRLEEFAEVFTRYPDVIWCVDAVSSLGGVKIPVDQLGIDVCMSSSQKALGLPPGLSLAAVSQKAIEKSHTVKTRGYYFDLILLVKYIRERKYQYPSTPSIPHLFALDFQLDRILAEGLDNRFGRHSMLAGLVRDWAKRHFALFPREDSASDTLTCIRNTRGLSVKDLNAKLVERGFLISNGYGVLKEKTFRIAHMADMTRKDIEDLLSAISDSI